jgi:hypothetical protein
VVQCRHGAKVLLSAQQGSIVLLILGPVFIVAGSVFLWAGVIDPGGWVTAWSEGNKEDYFYRLLANARVLRAWFAFLGVCFLALGVAALAVAL